MGRRHKRYRKKKPKYEYKYVEPTPEYIYNANFKLEIKKSNIDCGGNGVFTTEPIKANTIIGEYIGDLKEPGYCLLYTSPSPRDGLLSRMPSSA